MAKTVSWKIVINCDEETANQLEALPEAGIDQLNHNIATLLQEQLALTNMDELRVRLTPGEQDSPSTEKTTPDSYSASEHLVKLITSDFEGSLYPFALALGSQVKEFVEHLEKTDQLDERLHGLDTEMHQMITEVARTYARTGKWQP